MQYSYARVLLNYFRLKSSDDVVDDESLVTFLSLSVDLHFLF